MKIVLKMIIIFSLIIITACSSVNKNSVNEFRLIPSETDTIAIFVGGVDESGVSTDDTNLIVEEKHKISQVIDRCCNYLV
ncbi:hypothetical protein BKP45_10155 [Anaerobacillus alkalidiazotrophicus]|uniref:Uncharacterized protein n=1 Tax=Anaerobacillus alkalidiazotrophicus TaxID=472963 RepID=A0A1S2M6J8_9BACI|nr:hypothetical protein [Anaerobacillus alkalidiazotrophicus]OIJ20140.1 hypothetical protein BKP45_10155 [Anaerobacillus alkalidiazotrophicus]